MAVSALSAGLKCRCPNCGEGRVYRGFLAFKDRCDACGADFTIADAGDGPSFFVMFAALIFIVPSAMFFEFAFRPPGWVHAIIWPPITFAFCLFFLRPVKALLFALQWKHKAGEARLHDTPQE
ncbi:MAG TPA: DUF983 domain-containing protein [Hyphomonadaceae bacterium]|nr:DUF983 domain-containing protein [Hyphomonadaceae bacterium]